MLYKNRKIVFYDTFYIIVCFMKYIPCLISVRFSLVTSDIMGCSGGDREYKNTHILMIFIFLFLTVCTRLIQRASV